jgi:energy-coupling factor transporter ATP-binding protein EcfA2
MKLLNEYPRRYKALKKKMDERQQEDLRIVLIGERGAGKTTFVDFLYKICRGWKLQDSGHDSSIETKQIRADGTTVHTLIYTSKAPKTIRILEITLPEDMPKAIFHGGGQESISKVIEELGAVHAILMVINGTQMSLNDTIKQALRSISAILPACFSPNIGFLFTNCDISTVNFDMKTLPKEYQKFFSCFLQNPLPLLRKYEAAEEDGKTSKPVLRILQRNASRTFIESLDILDEMFNWLDSRIKQPTRLIHSLCDQLQAIRSIALDTVSRIDSAIEMRNEVKELQTKIGEFDQVNRITSSNFIRS